MSDKCFPRSDPADKLAGLVAKAKAKGVSATHPCLMLHTFSLHPSLAGEAAFPIHASIRVYSYVDQEAFSGAGGG